MPLLAIHSRSQYIVNPALIAFALRFNPFQHILIKPDGELFFRGGGQGTTSFSKNISSSGGISE